MFLTLEDPNAKIKGSRDPLGMQPVWATFGRHVVTNLTSTTGSIRGFTSLLLGRYLVERAIDDGRLPQASALEGFLRFEQVAAYARYVGHAVDADIRGIERVKRNVETRRGRVTIAANRDGYILSDQKVYGLWGLYSVSARVSGLIPEGRVGVTEAARAFIEGHYLPRLAPVWPALERLVTSGGSLDTRGRDPVLEAVASVLPETVSTGEARFYGEYLRDARHVEGVSARQQARFVELLGEHADLEAPVGRGEVLSLAAAALPGDVELARRLERIAALEALFAPAGALFDHALTRHGQRIDDVASDLADRWGQAVPNLDPEVFAALVPEIRTASTAEIAAHAKRCAGALASGAYGEALEATLDWNACVMHGRQGAPWARRDGERLDVRFRGAEHLLPEASALPALWRNSYFIDSLKRITQAIGADSP